MSDKNKVLFKPAQDAQLIGDGNKVITEPIELTEAEALDLQQRGKGEIINEAEAVEEKEPAAVPQQKVKEEKQTVDIDVPSKDWLKPEIFNWLEKNGKGKVDYNSNDTKEILLAKVQEVLKFKDK